MHNDDLNRALALPVSFVSDGLTAKPAHHDVVSLGFVRVLDVISNPPPGVIRGMPPFGVVVVLLVGLLLLINPSDWLAELKGALVVAVPFLLYWLKVRNERREKQRSEAHETADSMLRYSADKEKRLEDSARLLREEEREFMHRQMELSRKRGHILARGYMAVELANDRLIELLREKNIEVPQALLTMKTRAAILTELKELEAENGSTETSRPAD